MRYLLLVTSLVFSVSAQASSDCSQFGQELIKHFGLSPQFKRSELVNYTKAKWHEPNPQFDLESKKGIFIRVDQTDHSYNLTAEQGQVKYVFTFARRSCLFEGMSRVSMEDEVSIGLTDECKGKMKGISEGEEKETLQICQLASKYRYVPKHKLNPPVAGKGSGVKPATQPAK